MSYLFKLLSIRSELDCNLVVGYYCTYDDVQTYVRLKHLSQDSNDRYSVLYFICYSILVF